MAENRRTNMNFMVAGVELPAGQTSRGIAITLVDARGGRVRLHLSTDMAKLLVRAGFHRAGEGGGTGGRGHASRGAQLQQRRVAAG